MPLEWVFVGQEVQEGCPNPTLRSREDGELCPRAVLPLAHRFRPIRTPGDETASRELTHGGSQVFVPGDVEQIDFFVLRVDERRDRGDRGTNVASLPAL